MTAREFKNFPFTVALAAWIASASAANKTNMESKARKMYSESTYDSANREEKYKKMKMASNFIEKTTGTPLCRRTFPKYGNTHQAVFRQAVLWWRTRQLRQGSAPTGARGTHRRPQGQN